MASKTARVWAAGLLAVAIPGAVSAAPVGPDAGCVVTTSVSARRADTQEVAAARTGRIPGLGTVAASIGWDNRSTLTLSHRDFTVVRSFTPVTRDVELTIGGAGETPLVIRVAGAGGWSVARGGQVLGGGADPDAVRALLGGRAVAAFRDTIGQYERRLLAGPVRRVDDPHGYGFLLAGAFVASLAGDPAAFGRARDVMQRRIRGKILAARFDFEDCVTSYELYLLDIDTQRTQCLDAANGRDSWYARALDRLGCEAEFMAQALAGEGQFLSCTALGSILT